MRQPIKFGKYLLLERISVGGMAEVFKSKAFGVQGFEKMIAIKRILPSMAEDQDFIAMFIDEAKIAGQLSHANICQIFELGKIADSHFIAMEYVWGKDLLQIQNRFRRMRLTMPPVMAAYVCSKVAEGLDYAHRKRDSMGHPLQIIHRDVSPQNVILSYEGDVKVIDFGIAKAASRSSKTQAGVLKGKFGYMSPEQVRGLPLDRRSDIFAMGTILYELLCGERLFLGESDFSTLEKVRHADVTPLSRVNKDVPPSLERIVMKTLARAPEDRYGWAAELGEDLQAFVRQYDTAYSGDKLGRWMKEAFASELAREKQLLEQYKTIGPDGAQPAQPEESGAALSLLRAQVSGKQQARVTSKQPPPLAGRSPTAGMPAVRPPGSPPMLPGRAAAQSPTAKRDAEWELPGDLEDAGDSTQVGGPSFLEAPEAPRQMRRASPLAQSLSGEFDESPTEIHGSGSQPNDSMAADVFGGRRGGSGMPGAPLPSESTYILPHNQSAPMAAAGGAGASSGSMGQGMAQGSPGMGAPALSMSPAQGGPGTSAFSDAKTAILMDSRPPEPGPVHFAQPVHYPAGSHPGMPPAPVLSATSLVYAPPVTFTPQQMQVNHNPMLLQAPDLLSGYTPPPLSPLAQQALALGALTPRPPAKSTWGRDVGLALAACVLALGAMFAVKKVAFAGGKAKLGEIAVIARGGDARLFLNNRELGVCKADVPMRVADVAVGRHVVLLRWDDGRTRQHEIQLDAGEAEVVSGEPGGGGAAALPSPSASPAAVVAASPDPSEAARIEAEAAAREAEAKAAADQAAADQARADAEAKAAAEAEAAAAAEAEARAKAEAEAKASRSTDKASADQARAQAKAKAEAEAKARADAKAEAREKADAAAAAKAEDRAAAKAAAREKSEADAKARAEAKAAAKVKAEADAAAKAEAKAKAAADKITADAAGADPAKVGYLIANTEPWARVLIDGKDTGMMTPIAPRAKIPLKPGKHSVTFVIDGQKFKFPITIVAGEDYRLIKTLEIGGP